MTAQLSREQLKTRIEKALKDFTEGRAAMHVPPLDTDVDMVLSDCLTLLAGMDSEPPSFDELRDAVAEMTGGLPIQWSESTEKGHQAVPFINFNSLARIVDKFRATPPAPVAVPDDIVGIIERFQYQTDHLSDWYHIDEHSCKVNRRDLMTALGFIKDCRAAMLNGGK